MEYQLIGSENKSIAAKNWWDGSSYRANSSAQYDLAIQTLQHRSFVGNESVLDIGSGSGQVTSWIASQVVPQGQVVGLDVSQSMIDESQRAFGNLENLKFMLGDAAYFKLVGKPAGNLYGESFGAFDVIVSFSALHWVSDQAAVWRSIKDHLKVGGEALVALNPLPRDPDFANAIDLTVSDGKWAEFFTQFKSEERMPEMTIDAYRQIILDAGLHVEINDCSQSTRFFSYPSKQALTESVAAWLSQASYVPSGQRYAFVDDIISAYLHSSRQDERGPVKLFYNSFLVRASRVK